MAWEVVTQPAEEPVTVEQAIEQLRDDAATAQTALIERLIRAARQHIELVCTHAMMLQTWRRRLESFGDGVIYLPGGPFQSVTSVTYRDPDGIEQTLDPSAYVARLDRPARIAPADRWPETADRIDAVTIEVEAGYADVDAVPESLKEAILLLVTHWHENRSAVLVGSIATDMPQAVEALIFPYRELL